MSDKALELLDIVRLARPNLLDLDARQTASDPEFIKFVTGRGWGSYGPVWKRMPRIWQGTLSDSEIKGWWKTPWLVDAMQALRDEYKGHGRWYPIPQYKRRVGGFLFKTSVKGVLFTAPEGPEVHLVNPRKSQIIDPASLGFLARGAYEEYAIDDPNRPKIAILDLGSAKKSRIRDVKMYRGPSLEMIEVNHFEHIVNSFCDALIMSDFISSVPVSHVSANMFRIYTS